MLVDQLLDGISHQAASLDLSLDAGDAAGSPLGEVVAEQARAIDARITVIDASGLVLADSTTDPATMENHATRPEVAAALSGREGRAERTSATTGVRTLYIARPISNGRVIRVAVTADQVDRVLWTLRRRLLASTAVAAGLGLLVVSWVGRRLSKPLVDLVDVGERIATGDLAARASRSAIEEVDRIGLTLARVADDLGTRIRQVEEGRETLERILATIPVGVGLVTPTDLVEYLNPEFERVTGSRAAVLHELTPVDLQILVRSARTDAAAGVRIIERGSTVLDATATPLIDGSVLMVVADVTDARRLEKVRRDLVADASHELKTPVASILASAEAMEIAYGRDPEDARRFVAQMSSSAARLAGIVDDLLDLSRLEVAELEAEPLALDSVVREEARAFETRAASAGVALEVWTEPVALFGSRGELALVVRNLCDNAIRYSDRGASVTVSLTAEPGGSWLRVTDTGIGIPTRAIPRLFERFYRVDVARSRSTGGTGLGLSIVKHVVERHGGRIEVESELGRGSTFGVWFPVATMTDVDTVF